MSKSALLSLFAAMALLFCTSAHISAEETPSDTAAALNGTMRVYDFASVELRPQLPDSLRPLFISYVARHGARYLSSAKKVENAERILRHVAEAGALTPAGRECLEFLTEVKRVTANRWGALDSIGIAEQQRLAAEMVQMWPELMQSGVVTAKATFVPRVVMSMYEFCHTLGQNSPQLEIYTDAGHQNDPLLRFFDTDSRYVSYLRSGEWSKTYDAYFDSVVPEAPALRLVDSKLHLDAQRMRTLTMDLYGVLQSLDAIGMSKPAGEWLTPSEFYACWSVANLHHYLERNANPYSPIAAEAAKPLLQAMIDAGLKAADNFNRTTSSADVGTSSGTGSTADSAAVRPVAALFFGHAETVIPLFSLLDLPGCNIPYNGKPQDFNPALVATQWQDGNIAPLGANLEMVFLSAPTGNIYILPRLNGRNLPIRPLTDYQQLLKYIKK